MVNIYFKITRFIRIAIIIILALFSEQGFSQSITKTVGGAGANYVTLKAAFDAINAGTIKGSITLQITGSASESASAVLNASGTGSSSYTSLTIYPTVSGLSITNSGSFATPLIDINGSDYVTIDGRVNQAGAADLTISNTGTLSSTVRFINSAENNTVKYCYIKGAEVSSSYGIVLFSNSSSGNGNGYNVIDNNYITNSGSRPINAIYSSGSSTRENTYNTISNNKIYDFLSPGAYSYGINLASASSNWTISGNSFYETTTFAPTGQCVYNAIKVTTLTPHTISNNYIGGSQPLCAGTWTVNSSFIHFFSAITVNGGSSTATTVQNNVISNFNYTSTQSNPWDGIYIAAGNVDVIGNTIGATTGTGSIIINTPVASATTTISGGVVTGIILNGGGSGYTVAPALTFSTAGSTTSATATAIISGGQVTGFTLTSGGSGYTSAPSVIFDGATYSTSHGIRNFSTGTVNINNNNIGSVTTVGSTTYSSGFESIILNAIVTNASVCNNLVGSLTTPNSIYISANAVSSLVKEDVYGIYSMSSGTTVIRGNTIANLTNGYTGSNTGSRTRGIATTAGVNTIENNVVRDIKTSSAQNQPGSNAALIGISQTSSSSGLEQIVSGNTVYNLSELCTSGKVETYGIFSYAPGNLANQITKNFVYNLSNASSTVTSVITGINISNGVTICANNIVNLGASSLGYTINGISDNCISTNNTSIYFNSVYIGGSVSSGTTSSTYCLYTGNNTTTKNYRNNILYNARTSGTTGKHYAIYLSGTANLTINNNDYYFTGTNGSLGYLSSERPNLTAWKIATGQDVNSLNIDPQFTSAGGTNAADYNTSASLPGATGTGITTDYNGTVRNATPKMGALESTGGYVWKGNLSTDFNTAGNWLGGVVPGSGADISFATSPFNNCELDQNRNVGSVTNTQSAYRLVLNGKQLTISGSLNFSNGAQIDASATSSTVIFSGTSAQSIPSGGFYNNSIYNLTLNNSSGLTLNGNVTVTNALTLTAGTFTVGANTFTLSGSSLNGSGQIDASNSSSTLVFANSSAITLPATLFSGTVNNLTISNSGGITAGSDITVNGVLNLNAANPSATKGLLEMTKNYGSYPGSSSTDYLDSYILNMGVNAATTGTGDVTGTIKRAGILQNTAYTFGNQYTVLMLTTGTMPTALSVTVTIGTTPPGGLLGDIFIQDAIRRTYEIVSIVPEGYTSTSTVAANLHYLDNELISSRTGHINTEPKLVTWDYDIGGENPADEHGRAVYDFTNKYIGMANIPIDYFIKLPTHNWRTIFAIRDYSAAHYTWNGSSSSDWGTASNWTLSAGGSGVPNELSHVIIPDAGTTTYSPVLPSNDTINTLTIESGGVLTMGSSTLNIKNSLSGGWEDQNLNGNDPGTSKVVFLNSGATISGNSRFYDVDIISGADVTNQSGSKMKIAHNITKTGTGKWYTDVYGATVEYNGDAQNILLTDGSPNYHNLTLSGTGIKTLPSSSLTMHGSFTLTGSVNATALASIDVDGDFNIASGCTLNTGAYNHYLAGHLENYGTFNCTGSTLYLNGTLTQEMYGHDTLRFYNLSISNSTDVNLFTSTVISNTLSLNTGRFNAGSVTLTFINGNTPIERTNGSIVTDINTNLIFGNSGNISGNAFAIPQNTFNDPTQPINNFSLFRTNPLTLGQELTVNGMLALNSGLLVLGSNNLNLGTAATINGTPSSNNMIVTSSTGELRKYFPDNTNGLINSYIFPVGTNSTSAEYTPATISITSGVITSAYIGVNVNNTKNPNNTSTTDYLNRYWNVSQNGITGFTGDVTFQYLTSDVTGNENNIFAGLYNGTSWNLLSKANTTNHTISGTGITSFNVFSGGQEGVLPVHLSSFTSTINMRDIKLNWVTNSEINNSGFEVERAGKRQQATGNWEKIGYIAGKGTTNSPTNYAFEDRNLQTGKYKYRLKQIDHNGNFSYFNLNGEVEIGLPVNYNLSQNYPNPFNPVTKINFDLPLDSKVNLVIYDILGRELKTLINEFKQAGYYTLIFDASGLASGVYFYRITAKNSNKDFTGIKKMMLIK